MTYFFAWADEGESFSSSHHKIDLDVVAFDLTHTEGEFAILRMTVRNPREGLLAAGRKQWLWFSVGSVGSATPLFFGRLEGMPEEFHDEAVDLKFHARPADYNSRREAVAATLRGADFYDPIWLDETRRDDPDAVLEFHSRLWHVDRVTHTVTASDIITGEDGTVTIGGDFSYDSLTCSILGVPAKKVVVLAELSWAQEATGTLDLKETLLAAAQAAGCRDGDAIATYTGGGLVDDWPEAGDRIGAGWTVEAASAERWDGSVMVPVETTVELVNGTGKVPLWRIHPGFVVRYEASRQRVERIEFELVADSQAILTDPGEAEVIRLELSSADVDMPIDLGDEMPIGDKRRRLYLSTDRGKRSLAALIALARSRMLASARAVSISVEIPFSVAATLSCRKNATITDPRLPGGSATGKIIGYRMFCDGDSGEEIGEVTIACAVGKGGSVSASSGTEVYGSDYAASGWQATTGGTNEAIAGEVVFEDIDDIEPVDDGLDFFDLRPEHVVQDAAVYNGANEQLPVIAEFRQDMSDVAEALSQVYTEISVTLAPVTGGTFETYYPVTVSELKIPKQIDLEAA